VEIDVAGEDVHELVGHRVGDAGLVDRREQGTADRAAAHAQRGDQGRRLDAAGELAVGLALHHEALEIAVVGGPAHLQALQVAVVGDFGVDAAAGGAQHLLAGQAVLAEEGGRGGIVDAQAGQQRLRGVRGTHLLGGEEAETVGVERLALLGQGQGLHVLEDLAHGQGRGIRTEGGHGVGAAAAREHEGGDHRRDPAGVVFQRMGCAGHELLPEGPQSLLHRVSLSPAGGLSYKPVGCCPSHWRAVRRWRERSKGCRN